MNLMKKVFVMASLLFCISAVFAQRTKAPKWLDFDKRASIFPSSRYVVGFSSDRYSEGVDRKELEKTLQESSRTELVESILVNIRSMTTSNIVTRNEETLMTFRRTSVSLTNIELQGLKTETYFDDKNNEAFVISYADKTKISELYSNKVSTNKARIEQNLNNAKEYLAQNDKQNALKSYYSCNPIFREVEQAQTLIITFEGVKSDAPHLFFDSINNYKLQVNKGIKSLQSSKDLSLDDIAYLIAMGLKFQSDSIESEIRLNNFTFQDSKMASSFSKRFTRSLESKLTANKLQVKIHEASMIDNSNRDEYCRMTGTYWEEGENIKIIASIRNATTGKTLASSEASLSKKWLTDNGIDYKPTNYNKAVKNQVQFNNETTSTGGLLVEISTNKGSEGLIFSEDEEMKVYVRANKACYIRLIYHLADGNQVLLFDNYYIANNQANQVIEIPETFICSDPYGVETLQLNAQTQEFAPLVTKHQYGYDFITENLKDVLFKTRGFKAKNKMDAKTEKRIILTTMKK